MINRSGLALALAAGASLLGVNNAQASMPPATPLSIVIHHDVSPDVHMGPVTPARVKVYKNCKALNKKYKHGVGKKGAKDKTSGTPVTNFTVNTKVYKANKKSDRDKDGIACEKH